MPSATDPTNPPDADVELQVRGAVPPRLAGRVLGIDRHGVVHAIAVRRGGLTYSHRRLFLDVVPDRIVAFNGSLLAIGDGAPAYELSPRLDAVRSVDLAGGGRVLAGQPALDPVTGELHLVALDGDGLHAHVVVSAGALTRRSRPIADVPARIHGIVPAHDHVVILADGFLGIAQREGEARTTWTAMAVSAATSSHADTGSGWLIGVVDDAGVSRLHIHAVDDAHGPAAASAAMPRAIPDGMRCTWVADR